MSKTALHKILNMVLVKDFPVIEKIIIEIQNEDLLEPNQNKDYIVHIGISPRLNKK